MWKEEDKFGSDKTGWLLPFAYQEYSGIGIQFNVKPFSIGPAATFYQKIKEKPLNGSLRTVTHCCSSAPFLGAWEGN